MRSATTAWKAAPRNRICIVIGFVLLGFVTGGSAQTAPGVTPQITAAVDEAIRTRLSGNTHPLARPEFDQGAAPLDLPMNRMLLVLKRSPEQETALQSLLDQQHDKSSANYHRWLTPDQFGQQFGPADQDIQAITSWLQSHGFQVARVGRGRTAIEFSGTAAQVRDAFQTEIHSYLAGGAQHWANATDPQIPAALAPVVSGLAALHNFPTWPLLHVAGAFSKSIATGEIKPLGSPLSSHTGPLFTFNDSACGTLSCYGLGPYDFATIYNVLPLWIGSPAIDGTGQSIAIVGESNINPSDVQAFRSMFGLLPANNVQVIVDGPDPGVTQNDLETEALLDVEWSGAVAPGANIKFITSASTNTAAGVDLSALYAVDNNVAPVLSVSFGLCELFLGAAGNQFHNALWEQAAAQGITVLVASGDSGSAGCDRFVGLTPEPAQNGLAVSGFASTPFNVAVGGTDFMNFGPNFSTFPSPYWNATNDGHMSSAKGYIPESTWDSTCTNLGLGLIGFALGPEARCNDSRLTHDVRTLGGSGGKSNCISASGFVPSACTGGYAQPTWQKPALNDTARDLPDVSLFASNGFLSSFYIICEADLLPPPGNPSCNLQNGFANFIGVGGTSASAPAFAGIMALVNQFTGSMTGQGNANYELYKLGSGQSPSSCNSTTGPASSCIFNDVTFGTITMPCSAGSTPDCTVSLGGDKYGVLSGYDAGTGYDLATGLGSVNAFNLVHNWSNATFNSTTTTLTLEGVSSGTVSKSITHGTPVPVTITVTKNGSVSGTPSGDVSLIADSANGQGVDGNTLTNGMVSWMTNQLPGGSYSVHAHYAGDGTFGASDSVSIGVSVTQETSATTLSALAFTGGQFVSLPPSVSYGTEIYLRADVASATHANDSVPTGSVTFTDNKSASQTYSLNSEGAAIAGNGLCGLAPGAHSFTASYSGDNSYLPSGPTSPAAFDITQATPPLHVLPSQIAAAVNSTITLTVLVGGNININLLTGTRCSPMPPTGTVALFNGQTQIASSPIPNGFSSSSAFGQAVAVINFPASALPFGQSNITVKYSGDTNYLSVTSQPLPVQVGFATSTSLTSSSPSVAPGTNVTFTAQVTSNQSGGPTITGNVLFQIDGSGGTNVPLTTSGTAQFTASFQSATPNSHQINAQYSGDQNYIPSRASLQEGVGIPDFTLSDSLGNVSNLVISAPGASSPPLTLNINGVNGYNGTITFSPASCTITPAGSLSSCSFSPSSITGSGSTQVVITTTAPHAAATATYQFDFEGGNLPPIVVFLLSLVTLVIFKERRLRFVFVSVVLLASFGLWACSGGGNGSSPSSETTIPGTPTGAYTATINATPAGSNGHSISVPFIVQ